MTAASLAERLLSLQAVDTEIDQLTRRRERLPEREQLAAKTAQLTEWEQRRQVLRTRIDELTAAIESGEERGAELTRSKQRLEAQLKTVIAPREAEALMHEIATIDGERDEVDTAELEAMEEMSSLEEDLAAHLDVEPALREAVGLADGALEAVVSDIDGELAALGARCDEARADLDAGVLASYDRLRGQLGVAVSQLEGHRCNGCHLDLSAAEVDTAKEDASASGYTDCPQCGRMLVV